MVTEANPVGEIRATSYRDALYPLLTGLAIVTAIVVRWVALGRQSLWWDEGYTVWISQFSFREIWRGVATDTSPPLYYFLLHGWIYFFGISETSLRAMSAFFETLSLPVFFLLARRTLRNRAAVAIALWVFALSAFLVQYARDARFYGVLLFFSIVTVFSLISFLENRSWIAFGGATVSLTAALYTHNMAFFYLPGIAILWLLYPSAQSLARRARGFLLLGVLVLLLYLPWLPHLLTQARETAKSFWAPHPDALMLSNAINTLAGLNVEFLERSWSSHLPWLRHERALSGAGLLFLVLCFAGGLFHVSPENRRKIVAIGAYALLPIALVFFYSQAAAASVFIERVFIASAGVLPLIVTAPIAFQKGIRRRIFLAACVAFLLAETIGLASFAAFFRNEDWRGITASVVQPSAANRLVVFVPFYGKLLFDYYTRKPGSLGEMLPQTGLPAPSDFRDAVLPPAAENPGGDLLGPLKQAVQSRDFTEIDLIVRVTATALRDQLTPYLAETCQRQRQTDFNGILLVHCALPQSSD